MPDPEFDRAFGYAQTAIATLARRSIPPTPRFFELLYAYSGGTEPKLAERVEAEFRNPRLGAGDVERLCTEFLGTREPDDRALEFAHRLANSIDNLSSANGATAKSTAHYSAWLEQAVGGPGAGKKTLRQITETLLAETQRALAAQRELQASMLATRTSIDALQTDLLAAKHRSTLDPLTGIYNRKFFDAALASELAKNDGPLTLVMADIDHFKTFNDSWGHQTGDQVLRLVATTLKTRLREADIAARYGGEEFVVILPNTDLRGGVAAANKVREFLAAKSIVKQSTGEQLGHVTVSFGAALRTNGDSAATLIERADRCLYAAKKAGRNQVVGETELAIAERA